MSAPPGLMMAFPVAGLWVASEGALSVPAAMVAVAIFLTIAVICLVAGRWSTAKEGRHGRAPQA